MAQSQFDNKYCINCQNTKLVTDFVKYEMCACVAISQEHTLLCSLRGGDDDTCLGTLEAAKAIGVFLHDTCQLRELE